MDLKNESLDLTKLVLTYDVSVAGWLMRVDTKPVEIAIVRTLGRSGKLIFQTNLNYLDLGDTLSWKRKKGKKKKRKNHHKKPSY